MLFRSERIARSFRGTSRDKTAAESGRGFAVVSTRRNASPRTSTRTRQPWRERPPLAAGTTAPPVTNGGRSRHGSPSRRRAGQASVSGRHKTPPELISCNRLPGSELWLSLLQTTCGPRRNPGEPTPCTGGTPRPGACSPPCSPSCALRPCRPRERDGNTDEAVHDTPTALHHGRSHRTDSSTSRQIGRAHV